MRNLRLALALVLLWLLVLGTAAGIPWSAPLSPRAMVALNGQDFRPLVGAGVEDGTSLGIGAIATEGYALQTTSLERLRAADMPILRYHFEDFPRTLELVLVFRRADAPGDVQTAAMPWPGDGSVVVDLRAASKAWRGEITELGFAEYPTTQLVPPSIAFRPFRLVDSRLQSPAWNAAPALLVSGWFGYRPWSQASINVVAQGAEGSASMPLTLALGGALTFGLLAWLKREWRARLPRLALLVALSMWVALDVCGLDDLWSKHKLTTSIYSGKSWQERARLQPDEDVAGFAQLTREHVAAAGSGQRVLVASDSVFKMLRLIYFLLPLNAAPLDSALSDVPVPTWPADTAIVICASKIWHYDDATSTLRAGAKTLPVTPLFIGGELGVYRLRQAAP
ncbi:MAG TPA: hypothetical protein VHQ21_07995 [Rhodanobacteraceae bacterium]|jgi:hypothetical protein|nr:hypothetical protein [Rhodanobacteraceae bacterium]